MPSPLRPILAALVCMCLLVYVFRPHRDVETDWSSVTGEPPANSTLGFGAILAVSREGSSRREGLLQAANISSIDIEIPLQPTWTDEHLKELRSKAGQKSILNRGSALAWLGHLNALRWFMKSGLETALIIEDDVDWDTHLRTTQIPQVAAAVRRLTSKSSEGQGTSGSSSDGYYGSPGSWDILYIGHCGDRFDYERAQRETIDSFDDDTLLTREKLHEYTRKFLEDIRVPAGKRLVHASVFPLCSFGYVVTRYSASRLLGDLAGYEPEPGCMAYDVRLLEGCRDQGLRCYTVNPELMHHMTSPSEIAIVNSGAGLDEEGRILRQGPQLDTPNIKCAARSFRWSEMASLRFLRSEVSKPGQCLTDPMGSQNAPAPPKS